MLLSLIISCSIFARLVLGQTYLWDLNTDPYEANNVYGTSTYSAKQAELLSMITQWKGLAGTCSDVKTSLGSGLYNIYNSCGGVCPNVTKNFYKRTVTQKYFPAKPPNIVFVLVDDWGYNDVGVRSTYMSWTTPTIDAYINQGITLTNYFTHYYCTPSRGALMTGRYATRLGLMDVAKNCELPVSENTMAQELQSAGYKTYMVGKWNLG
jgi:hypothetical protein